MLRPIWRRLHPYNRAYADPEPASERSDKAWPVPSHSRSRRSHSRSRWSAPPPARPRPPRTTARNARTPTRAAKPCGTPSSAPARPSSGRRSEASAANRSTRPAPTCSRRRRLTADVIGVRRLVDQGDTHAAFQHTPITEDARRPAPAGPHTPHGSGVGLRDWGSPTRRWLARHSAAPGRPRSHDAPAAWPAGVAEGGRPPLPRWALVAEGSDHPRPAVGCAGRSVRPRTAPRAHWGVAHGTAVHVVLRPVTPRRMDA